MADVTISQLNSGTPSSNSVIPFSSGSSTLKTSPGGIIAAAPGTILRVTQNVLDTIVSVTHSPSPSSSTVIPGLSASITPLSSSNKILVDASVVGGAGQYVNLRLERSIGGGAFTPIGVGQASGSRVAASTQTFTYEVSTNVNTNAVVKFLDSPNTLSEVHYRLCAVSNHQTVTLNINTTTSNANAGYTGVAISTITLWEVVG